MTETARKKKAVARKPKRTARKQVAKTCPPTTSSPATSTPPLPLSFPLRTRSEPQLDLPPRYSLLFPPEHINLPQRSRQPLPSSSLTPAFNSSRLLLPPATSHGSHTASPDLALTRPVTHPERPIDAVFFEELRPSPEAIAHEALCNLISTKFDSVITSIDGERFGGEEQDLLIQDDSQSGIRGGWGFGTRQVSRGANRAISTAIIGTNYFAKVNLYANSRLPPNLPPLQL